MKNIELLLVALFCLYGCGQPKPQKSSPEVHIPVAEMYQKPFKYIGMDVKEASQLFAVQENSGGNLVFDTAKQHYLFEANDGKISYVDIGFLETAPCNQAVRQKFWLWCSANITKYHMNLYAYIRQTSHQ
jgi:hypothetical protein